MQPKACFSLQTLCKVYKANPQSKLKATPNLFLLATTNETITVHSQCERKRNQRAEQLLIILPLTCNLHDCASSYTCSFTCQGTGDTHRIN